MLSLKLKVRQLQLEDPIMTYDKPKHEKSMRLYNLCKIHNVFGYVNHKQAHLYLGFPTLLRQKAGSQWRNVTWMEGRRWTSKFLQHFFPRLLRGKKSMLHTLKLTVRTWKFREWKTTALLGWHLFRLLCWFQGGVTTQKLKDVCLKQTQRNTSKCHWYQLFKKNIILENIFQHRIKHRHSQNHVHSGNLT